MNLIRTPDRRPYAPAVIAFGFLAIAVIAGVLGWLWASQ